MAGESSQTLRDPTIFVLQWCLIIFNLILMLVGMVLLGCGVYLLTDPVTFLACFKVASMASSSTPIQPFIEAIGIAVSIIGATTMFGGSVGILNVARPHQATFALHLLFIAFACCGLLSIGMASLLDDSMTLEKLDEVLSIEVNLYQNVNDRGILAWSHQRFNCCGILRNDTCLQNYPGKFCKMGSKSCSKGCLEELWPHVIEPALKSTGITSLVSCGVLVFVAVLSLITCCKRHYQSN